MEFPDPFDDFLADLPGTSELDALGTFHGEFVPGSLTSGARPEPDHGATALAALLTGTTAGYLHPILDDLEAALEPLDD